MTAVPNEAQPPRCEEPRADAKLSPTQRNAEAIIAHLNEYLAIRFDHAARINPHLRHMKADVLYHEISNVRRTLLGEKIYGPVRLTVADVFISDDDVKRRRLISPSDQTSVQVELVCHCQDEKVEGTRGQIRFHDLKSFYAAINPELTNFIDLLESWIWWDILDAVELVRFEQKLGKIALVRQGKVSDEMRRRYALILHPLTETDLTTMTAASEQTVIHITDEDIVRYEFGMLQQIRDQWRFRHHGELGYKFVLQREPEADANQGELIHRIAAKVREYDGVEALPEANEDIQHAYAPDLKMQPTRVTKEAILEHLQQELLLLEREMVTRSDEEKRLGEPFNFKERQLDKIEKWVRELQGQLAEILSKPMSVAPPPSIESEPSPSPKPVQAKPAENRLVLSPMEAYEGAHESLKKPAVTEKLPPMPSLAQATISEADPFNFADGPGLPGAMTIHGTPAEPNELDMPEVDPKLGF